MYRTKKEVMVPAFQRLAGLIGKERVVWRYDPILFTEKYTPEYHLKAFEQIAEALQGYTDTCVISFLDWYAKIDKNLQTLGVQEKSEQEIQAFAGKLGTIAGKYGLQVLSCAEKYDLKDCGIMPGHCIDRQLIESLTGSSLQVSKDKNQRPVCGCAESVEVGTYNTCLNGCKYCYANYSMESVQKNIKNYDMHSPLLCGCLQAEDKVTERKAKSLKTCTQLSLEI